jgi:hypothetical protein
VRPAVLEGHTNSVFALACTPDGTTLASGSSDKTIRLWRLADNTCTAILKGHTNSVLALACTPDGTTLASSSHDNTIRLWRLVDNTCTAVLEEHTNSVYALACTPDGATLASGSDDDTIRLWCLADNTCTAVLEGHTDVVRALACTPNGAILASGSDDDTVCLWRLADNTCNAVLKGHTSCVRSLACTPDGATLASGSLDNTVRLWCLADKACTAVLESHAKWIIAVACTPDGATLASGSDDKTIRLWHLADNTCTAILEGHTSDVNALASTPDGATLASGSRDKTVRLWRRPFLSALACDLKSLASLSNDDVVVSDFLHRYIAASGCHDALALILRLAPAFALVKDESGRVAMHVAVEMQELDTVALLLRHAPACVLIEDNKGRLPLDLAIEINHRDASRLLRRATDEQRLLALGSRSLDALKLFLCGDSRAGKTTLSRTLRSARSDPLLDHTASIDVKRAAFALSSSVSISLSLYDFAGHHQFHAMHELILAEPNAVFAVLVDASRPADEQRRQLLYWLRLIATRVALARRLTAQTETRPTVVVLGTHADHPAAEATVLNSALEDTLAGSSGWSFLLDIRAEDLTLVSCLSKTAVVDALQAPLERAWKAISGGNFKAPTILDKLGPILARLGTSQPLWMLDDLAEALTHVKVQKSFGRRDAKASAAVHAMQGDVLAATLRCVMWMTCTVCSIKCDRRILSIYYNVHVTSTPWQVSPTQHPTHTPH